jgi:hypothetical protein
MSLSLQRFPFRLRPVTNLFERHVKQYQNSNIKNETFLHFEL